MSIAWSTIAFLVLLLPGFLFLVGIYFPENFTRETAPKSSHLVLSGDHVLNVVFDRHAFTQTRAGMRALGDALANEVDTWVASFQSVGTITTRMRDTSE